MLIRLWGWFMVLETHFVVLSFLCVLRAVQFRICGVVFDIIDAKPICLHPTNHQLGPSHRAKHYPSSQCYGPTSSDRGSQQVSWRARVFVFVRAFVCVFVCVLVHVCVCVCVFLCVRYNVSLYSFFSTNGVLKNTCCP